MKSYLKNSFSSTCTSNTLLQLPSHPPRNSAHNRRRHRLLPPHPPDPNSTPSRRSTEALRLNLRLSHRLLGPARRMANPLPRPLRRPAPAHRALSSSIPRPHISTSHLFTPIYTSLPHPQPAPATNPHLASHALPLLHIRVCRDARVRCAHTRAIQQGEGGRHVGVRRPASRGVHGELGVLECGARAVSSCCWGE